METVFKVLRNFTILILRKIEITIDFNGPEGRLLHSNTRKWNGAFFLNITKSFLRSLMTICIIIYVNYSSEYRNLSLVKARTVSPLVGWSVDLAQ